MTLSRADDGRLKAAINFRSAPNTSSTSYGELKNGTAVTVLSTSNGWSKVSYAGKAGYISADYLVTASSGTAISPSNTAASVSISAKRQSVLNYAAQLNEKYGVYRARIAKTIWF